MTRAEALIRRINDYIPNKLNLYRLGIGCQQDEWLHSKITVYKMRQKKGMGASSSDLSANYILQLIHLSQYCHHLPQVLI